MLDMPLYILVRQCLIAQAPLRALVDVEYPQRYQPTQQGRNTERTVYMHKINDKRYGYRSMKTNGTGPAIVRTETQSMETTLQFSVTQPPAMDVDQFTHDDVLKIVAATLQSEDAVKFLVNNGASVLRVTDIRNMFVKNDRGQFEPNPTFDLVIKHDDVFVDGVPQVNTFEFEAYPLPDLA